MLHRLIYRRLIHRAHRFHRKGCSRGRLLDCLGRLLRSHSHRFFSACARRFCEEFSRLFRNRRRCLCRDHLDYIVCDLIAATVAPQRRSAPRPWARAPALKVTETNAVASAKKIGRLRTSARYAGNHKPWQAFFSIKTIGGWSLTGAAVSMRTRNDAPNPFQSSGK